MNVFIAVPANKEADLRIMENAGFMHNQKRYDFSVVLGEPLLAEKNGENWLIFCHKRAEQIIDDLKIEREINGEIIITSKEYEEIVELVSSVGGFVEQDANGLNEFILKNSFVIQNGE